mgnify:CR=1 FL=1
MAKLYFRYSAMNAGKSTLLRTIIGLIEPDTGVAVFAACTAWVVYEMYRYQDRLDAADDPLDEMTPTVQGSREARLQFAVEVIADQRAGHNAAAIVEKARTRFTRPSIRSALEAVGLALAVVGPATQADYPADGRMVSRSLFEVALNGHASEADTTSRTSYIATVEAVAAIEGVDGVDLPDAIQPSQE